MPACTRSARSPMSTSPRPGTPTPCATRSTRICGRIRSRCSRPSRRRRFRRAVLGGAAPLPLPHRQPPRRSRARCRRARCGCRGRSMRRRCTPPPQRLVGRHDFTTFRAAECQAKSPVKTLDRLDVERHGEEVRITPRRARSCTTRCARWSGSLVAGRRRPLERRRPRGTRSPPATARPAARSRRPTGFIWCGWIIRRRARESRLVSPATTDFPNPRLHAWREPAAAFVIPALPSVRRGAPPWRCRGRRAGRGR